MYYSMQRSLNMNDEELAVLLRRNSDDINNRSDKRGNPLKVVSYLKLLCVHPSLVVDKALHSEHYDKICNDIFCSGKLIVLARILVESGVISVEEILLHRRLDEISVILSHDLFSGLNSSDCDDVIGKTRVAAAKRPVTISQSGRKMPILKSKQVESLKQMSESDSSSDSDDYNNPERQKKTDLLGKDQKPPYLKKCLIFAQHRCVLDIIESLIFKKYFPFVRYSRMDGAVPPEKRNEIIEDFNSEVKNENKHKELRILLMTARSCGLGLNLSAADTVIFVEMDWNPFVDAQAMDRAHRIGQTRPVTVFRLVTADTIEERVMDLQSRKEAIASEIVNEDNESMPTDVGMGSQKFDSAMWNSLSTSIEETSQNSKNNAGSLFQEIEDRNYESFKVDGYLLEIFGDTSSSSV